MTLTMAAKIMQEQVIGATLGIAARTGIFHKCNVHSRLCGPTPLPMASGGFLTDQRSSSGQDWETNS